MAAPITNCRCGEPHPNGCRGHSSRTGKPCKKNPIRGGFVCEAHGGSAGQVRRAADERLRKQAQLEAVATFGLPREIDPQDALLEEVHRSAGAVQWLGNVVAALEHDDAKQYTYDSDGRRWEKPAVWVEMYQAERRHLVTVCARAIAAGVEERRVRLAEQQGELLVRVLEGALAELGLADDQHAREVVGRHLRAVAN